MTKYKQGLFIKQYGTPNYAAHSGFYSVNMMVDIIYTISGSFFKFSNSDLERMTVSLF
ncbi:hypothetical protein [Candidatus Ruthturnera calyptogenae]|uniref:hypothetical protein n=1 Tax=Candidatus Ruthturnera calyptogenae TaxID=386487 RepID=UPI0003005C05|nr:hypothetical protein [Candidatus Ruthturnera calyptogenae]